jgi:hypothetical protein
VTGSGTPGQITKWTGVDGSNSYTVGNSSITEDKFGNVGVGTKLPTSRLTVAGVIQSSIGGFKFPDGTTQTTAGIANVIHDATLTGNGTTAAPLGVASPLALSGAVGLSDAVIKASNTGTGAGLFGESTNGFGVAGESLNSVGVTGFSANSIGVVGTSNTSFGVNAISSGNGTAIAAVKGTCASCAGVFGESTDGIGVRASSTNNVGITADSMFNTAIIANADFGLAIQAASRFNTGIRGSSGATLPTEAGIVGVSSGFAINAIAGRFLGRVGIVNHMGQPGNLSVQGTLSKGAGTFKIDHPLDPENKYLYHSFVESPDMMNIYNGNITTDDGGDAVVTLPDYFDALNTDFRYQLTVIGQFAQAIVAEEIKGNRFIIKTNAPNVKVSWQVTGVRNDAFARKNRVQVEEEKPEIERGYYLHPDAYGKPEEKSIQWARDPEGMKQLRQRHIEAEQRRKQQPNQR